MVSERILVVDDEPAVMHSCERILKRQNYTVTGLTDSTAASALLREQTFDLLLSDIKMPRIDGLELLEIAKEIDPHITVVLITGYGTMEDAIRAIRLGAQGFLMKPFDPKELVATVEDSLAKRDILRNSLRLQMLLPLLEINKMLQVSGGEVSLVQQVLQIAGQELGATRLAWLSCQPAPVEVAVVAKNQQPSRLPPPAITAALDTRQPVWVLSDGTLASAAAGQPNVVGALLPLFIKGQLTGLLTAETDAAPFGQISLDLLTVLAGQLAIIIENNQLFQQAQALRIFNEDIIKNMTNGLIAINQAGIITAFNPAAAQMLGYPAAEVLHQPLTSALTSADKLINIFNATLTTGQDSARKEISVPHCSGRPIPISVSAATLGHENGQSLGVVGVIEDLTEIKALEAEHRRLDRLAALGEMSAVVAHEIRNPIAGIATGVDYLTRHASANSVEGQGAAMIQKEIKRVNRIVEDILFVARPLLLNRTCQPLPPIIHTVQQRCQAQLNSIELVTRLDDNLPPLNVDNERLEQVLTNLVINAAQAMPGGGQITLSAQHRCAPPAIIIKVDDTGPGIPVDVRSRIFDPFFTTKTKGTGLGLSVARRIIEEHGGVIQIDDAPDTISGASFIILLPLEEPTEP